MNPNVDDHVEDGDHLHVGFAVVHLDRLLSAHPTLLLFPLLCHHHHHQGQDQDEDQDQNCPKPTCKMSLERLCAASIDFRCIPEQLSFNVNCQLSISVHLVSVQLVLVLVISINNSNWYVTIPLDSEQF